MAVKLRMSEEDIIQSIKQTKQFLEMQKKGQRWLYLLVLGSFALIVFLNYTFPNIYSVEKRLIYDVNSEFIGLILTIFGFTFLINAFFFRGIVGESIILYILTWVIGATICVILLYYGLPLFFGFKW